MPKKATPKRAQGVLYELMKRDPLGQQLTALIIQLYAGDYAEQDDGPLVCRLFECEDTLCNKVRRAINLHPRPRSAWHG